VPANEAGSTGNEDETSRHLLGYALNSLLFEGELYFFFFFLNVLKFICRPTRGLFILSG